MKFLRNKHLKHLGAFVIVISLIVLIVQFLIIDSKESQLEEARYKIEFTQVAQLQNQKIALMVQSFLNGNTSVGPDIAAAITKQDHNLKTLREGGRIDGRDIFIRQLTLLPAITFMGMKEDWENYKQTIFVILTNDPKVKLSSDSTNENNDAVLVTNSKHAAKIKFEGLSISMSNWYDKLIQDLDEEVSAKSFSLSFTKYLILFANFLLVGGIYYLFITFIVAPLDALQDNIKEHKHTTDLPENELGAVARAANETIESLKDATDFVAAIGQGNLAVNYRESFDKNYVAGNNKLADSLIEMQTKLREMNEEEQKRQWANEGLTKFVEILRSSNDNLRVLGDKIISGLIHYTSSNQGALYILNDEEESDKHLELISLYAWDIKKHEQHKIKPGQGILGQAFLEKETTFLTALPEEYIRITSGLGGANPKCVLIVPLKVDQDVYGLVELASFNELKPHEIAFVEKLGETLASTLSSVKAAQKNKHLIEQFQQQTEEMRAQEEEMRQNMEELQATQEEIVRKEKTYVSTIHQLEDSLRNNVSAEELNKLRESHKINEDQLLQKIKKLEQELAQKPAKSDDWVVAEELNKALRINLQALKVTQEELRKNERQ